MSSIEQDPKWTPEPAWIGRKERRTTSLEIDS